ncbi:MAG: GTP cyclohydrolase I FolE [Blastocatellales bacterium]
MASSIIGRDGDELAVECVRFLINYLGEDSERDGLLRTPERVVSALCEMTAGHAEDPAQILGTTFDEYSDEMIIVRGVKFTSLCEHHLLPFIGSCDLAYLPSSRVVGLSKLPRLVLAFARRLQIQERMTRQIAEAIQEHLDARGVAVIIKAQHLCMACRGVKQPSAEMITSAMLGVFRDNEAARNEFLQLTRA